MGSILSKNFFKDFKGSGRLRGSLLFVIVALASTSTLWSLGCASFSPQAERACASTDWYEIGRQDGAKGHGEEYLDVRLKECAPEKRDLVTRLYFTGRNAGLVDYCSPTNGFNLGRSGQPYARVCPSPMERDFLREYRKGQRVFELEQANRQIDHRIGSLSQELERAIPLEVRNGLVDQLNELRQTKRVNDLEIQGLRTN